MADQTRDIFDVVSTYFVNVYWFHLYKHANDAFQERQYPNLEDAYKSVIDKYRIAFCVKQNSQGRDNDNYFKIITDLQNNYNTWMDTKLTHGDFIDLVCRQMIPEDVYKTLGRQDTRKDNLFRKSITQSVTNFSVYIATQGLDGVIKQRGANSKLHQMACKEALINILYSERNTLYGRFMATKSGVNPSKQEGQISREAFDKMVQKIKELINDKAKLQNELNMFIFAAKKESAIQKSEIAKLNAMLGQGSVERLEPRIKPIKQPVEVVSEEETSSESDSVVSGLEKINDPAKDDFLVKKIPDKNDPITKPLDEVPEYSGEDVIEASKVPSDDDESSSMSMDE